MQIANHKSQIINRQATIALLLVLFAFALRLQNIGLHSLWYDELLELDIAAGPLADIAPQLRRHAAMPLDYYLQHIWTQLGRQEPWVRFPSLFFGVLTVAMVYRLGRRMFNRQVALSAMALTACAFFSVRYSQETRPYAMLAFFTTLTFMGLWHAVYARRPEYWGPALAGMTGAALSHYFAIFLIAPIGLFVISNLALHLRQKDAWLNSVAFGLMLTILLIVFTVNGRFWLLYSVGERFSREVTQPEVYTLPAAQKPNRGSGPPLSAEFLLEDIIQPLSASTPLALNLFLAFAAVAVSALFWASKRQRLALLLLMGWLVLPIGLIYLFLLHRGTFYATRYILYTLPPFLLLVAYGLSVTAGLITSGLYRYAGLQSRSTALWPVVMAVLLMPLLLAQFDTLQKHYTAGAYEDWRAVGDLLHQNALSTDAVIAVKAEPAINWYAPAWKRPFGTYSRSESIWAEIAQHSRRWFVLNSYSRKQDQGLRDWLQQQNAAQIVIDRRVTVYFSDEGKSAAEILAQVQNFSLPQNAITYQMLAEQFRANGDVETARIFQQRAVDLNGTVSLFQKLSQEIEILVNYYFESI